MGFLLQMFDSESFDDSGHSLTSGDSQNIDHLVFLEDWINFHFFFEEIVSEFDFVSDGSSVDLDFLDVIFLGSQVVDGGVVGVGD